MSELRIHINGENLDSIVKTTEGKDNNQKNVSINGQEYELYKFNMDSESIFFITGWSDECYEELADIRYNLALSSPGKTFSFFYHSTYTGLDNSFNFGCIDGEYKEWEDCRSRAYFGKTIICDGIGNIPEYGETDEWKCTSTLLNGKEYRLNELSHNDDCIKYDEAFNGTHCSEGFIEEIVKAVRDKKVFVEEFDYTTGECWGYEYIYKQDTGEVLREEIEDYMWRTMS